MLSKWMLKPSTQKQQSRAEGEVLVPTVLNTRVVF